MATVLNRITMELITSVHTPDYDPVEWLVNPDLSGVAGVPAKYWTAKGEVVREMTSTEKAVVDATELLTHKAVKLDLLREAAMQRAAEASTDYKTAKAEVALAADKAAVDAVTLKGV